MRRSDFFKNQTISVSIVTIVGRDGADAHEEEIFLKDALVSFGSQTLSAPDPTIPNGTIRVFLNGLPEGTLIGDVLRVNDQGSREAVDYAITSIDSNAVGANARRYKTRIEARRA